ncbi:hypothetical protein BDK51DRAFT_45377 [Blyttiomyces helicus]|uniref:Uncharacterized protein n=1 Tax=Blyttiomyces helicus TaxID=388810 RepID=A0A4P9VXU0_9FUNG|nr:hypothetical protein BDK51DRAFT_45377 [Blyttiomyces helicus]|eukprot:RKO83755.1 hypothetical protein BDK51DRAFT_45377 [Blyttiomyces helicus]
MIPSAYRTATAVSLCVQAGSSVLARSPLGSTVRPVAFPFLSLPSAPLSPRRRPPASRLVPRQPKSQHTRRTGHAFRTSILPLPNQSAKRQTYEEDPHNQSIEPANDVPPSARFRACSTRVARLRNLPIISAYSPVKSSIGFKSLFNGPPEVLPLPNESGDRESSKHLLAWVQPSCPSNLQWQWEGVRAGERLRGDEWTAVEREKKRKKSIGASSTSSQSVALLSVESSTRISDLAVDVQRRKSSALQIILLQHMTKLAVTTQRSAEQHRKTIISPSLFFILLCLP